MHRLIACGECARHLRASEPSCPFCGAALPEIAPEPTERAPARLGRAAILALGATFAATGLAGCVTSVPLYGGPADAGAEVDAGPDASLLTPAYGAPGP